MVAAIAITIIVTITINVVATSIAIVVDGNIRSIIHDLNFWRMYACGASTCSA